MNNDEYTCSDPENDKRGEVRDNEETKEDLYPQKKMIQKSPEIAGNHKLYIIFERF